MTDYADIIARLEKATGPDEHLDVDIQLVANPTQWKYCNELRQEMLARAKANGLRDREEACWRAAFGGLDRYTASIDAALTLVPEGLYWMIGFGKTSEAEPLGGACIFEPGELDNPIAQAEGATVPISICIAAIKARAVS